MLTTKSGRTLDVTKAGEAARVIVGLLEAVAYRAPEIGIGDMLGSIARQMNIIADALAMDHQTLAEIRLLVELLAEQGKALDQECDTLPDELNDEGRARLALRIEAFKIVETSLFDRVKADPTKRRLP